MFIYTVASALGGLIAAIIIAVRTKKSSEVVYGSLDKLGLITNIVLAILYASIAPGYLFIGMIAEPAYEGFLGFIGCIVGGIIASAGMCCALGIGLSVSLRKKGMSKLSFAIQFLGAVSIAVSLLLYAVGAGNLICSLN